MTSNNGESWALWLEAKIYLRRRTSSSLIAGRVDGSLKYTFNDVAKSVSDLMHQAVRNQLTAFRSDLPERQIIHDRRASCRGTMLSAPEQNKQTRRVKWTAISAAADWLPIRSPPDARLSMTYFLPRLCSGNYRLMHMSDEGMLFNNLKRCSRTHRKRLPRHSHHQAGPGPLPPKRYQDCEDATRITDP